MNGIVALAGGVGAAKFLRGLMHVGDKLTVIGNVGDNIWVHSLYVAPDLDIVTYALAGIWDEERGWGIKGEGYAARDLLRKLGLSEAEWYNLGDQDLAVCLYRTHRMKQGVSLSVVTSEISHGLGVIPRIIPATDRALTTMVRLDSGWTSFEEYYVRLGSRPAVHAIEYSGAETCTPAPGVIEAIASAEKVIVCPSNPVASIAPILAVPAIKRAISERREDTVVISPLIQGKALKGPADRMMASLGIEPSVRGLIHFYRDIANTLVVDMQEEESGASGMKVRRAPIVIHSVQDAHELAALVLSYTN